MLVPAILYGIYRKVSRQVRSGIGGLARGASFAECMRSENMVDTDKAPGFLILEGPSPLLGGTPGFHLFAPPTAARALLGEKLTRAHLDAMFEECLTTSWGTLSLMGHSTTIWVYREERHIPFLDAVERFWDEWAAAGDRYSSGSTEGSDLWSLTNALHYVLANRGVDKSALRSPLPPGGVAELIARAKRN